MKPWTDKEILALHHNGAIKVLQRRVAQLSGINYAYVAHWENDDAYPHVDQQMREFRAMLVKNVPKTPPVQAPRNSTLVLALFRTSQVGAWHLPNAIVDPQTVVHKLTREIGQPLLTFVWNVPAICPVHAEVSQMQGDDWPKMFATIVEDYGTPETIGSFTDRHTGQRKQSTRRRVKRKKRK